MKRFFCLLTVLAFIVAGTMVMAAEKAQTPMKLTQGAPVKCCVKGKCTQVGTSADCAKAGGKVVKDCKECK